jgi:hypothetical protein
MPSGGGKLPGESIQSAVCIAATNELQGVASEYHWLRDNLPGTSVLSQRLYFNEGKPYDILEVECADGTYKNVYFDISGFFGKTTR